MQHRETIAGVQGSQLFNQPAGSFVPFGIIPFKDQKERRVISGQPAPPTAGKIDDEDAAEIKRYGHVID